MLAKNTGTSVPYVWLRRSRRHIAIRLFSLVSATLWLLATVASAADLDAASQGIVECTDAVQQRHKPTLAAKIDRLVCFEAYISNFNTGFVDDERGRARHPGIPHWV